MKVVAENQNSSIPVAFHNSGLHHILARSNGELIFIKPITPEWTEAERIIYLKSSRPNGIHSQMYLLKIISGIVVLFFFSYERHKHIAMRSCPCSTFLKVAKFLFFLRCNEIP